MKNTSNKPFYVITPIYYVNAKPHVGHAYTTIVADCVARYQRLSGKEEFFSVGTDEHGMNIEKRAEEAGKPPEIFVAEIALIFKDLWAKLNISYSKFIRTTDPEHKEAVQKVLQDFYDRKIIYKGFYEGLYCTGCEQFKVRSDLALGKCPDHNRAPEIMKEETYLMKMTELQPELIRKIENDELEVRTEKYKKEILSFLKNEKLEDISISRKNVSWGIPLPFDDTHTTYVWLDAFLNYLTVLGWDGDREKMPREWPADVQFLGKDILRVHATIWPIMLLHLGFPLPKLLFTHGHILSGGRKMSKTIGNTISADLMIEKFGVDGTRYLLMSAGTFGEDVDLTMERMTEKYNADLANGLGNLLSRVIKLSEQLEKLPFWTKITKDFYPSLIEEYKFSEALERIWHEVRNANKYIDDHKPWELVTGNKDEFIKVMDYLFLKISGIAYKLKPFMPGTSEKIEKALRERKTTSLFERIKA